MKNSIGLLILLFVTVINAQEVKHLNLEDAVLGYYKGLYPERKSLQWIDGADDFIIAENNRVLINYNLEKDSTLFSFNVLKKSFPAFNCFDIERSFFSSDIKICKISRVSGASNSSNRLS